MKWKTAQSQGGPLQDRCDMTGLAATSRKLPLATYPYGIRKDERSEDGIASADRVRRDAFVSSRASVCSKRWWRSDNLKRIL